MFFSGFFDDFSDSFKNRSAEEKYDLVFSRPGGYILAKILGGGLKLSPNAISLLGMFIGMVGGAMLFRQDSLLYTGIAGFLITLAGVLDSADGQAARLYNRQSQLGRYYDAIIDNVVFISCYIGAILYFVDTYTLLGCLALGAVSGAVHSIKTCIYEYYKGEFIFFCGGTDNQRNEDADYYREHFVRNTLFEKFVYIVLVDYVKKQHRFKFRSDEVTKQFEQAKDKYGSDFEQLFLSETRGALSWWAWVSGSNVMRNGIVISSLFGHFDYFAFLNIASYALFLLAGKVQQRADQRVLDQVNKWELTQSPNEMTQLQEK